MGELGRYRGEVLFIYGGADREGAIAGRHFEGFAARSGLKARFHVVEGSNHNFYSLPWENELMDAACGFVVSHR